MHDTYTQLYIQLVFSVKNRQNFIQHTWKDQLYKYIASVIQHDNHKMLAINGMPDHIHIFFGLNPAIGISEVVKDVKRATNNWINNNKLVTGTFAWQSGYGAFSYSHSHIHQVCNYIEKQEYHHAKTTFRGEYTALLKAFNIEFKNECLFEFYD
jgi:putative transposase